MEKQWRLRWLVFFLAVICIIFAVWRSDHMLSSDSEKALDRLKAKGKLIAAVSVYQPFVYFDAQSQRMVGYDIDLAQAIAAKIGVPLEIKEVQFTSLIPAVQSGQADMALGAIYITEARLGQVDFSVSYLETGIVLVARKKPVIDSDLNVKVVGVKAGGTSEKVAYDLKNKQLNIVIKSYRDAEGCLQDLESGRIDVALNDLMNQLEYNKTHKDLIIVGDRLTNDSLGVAVRKGNDELREVINVVIAEMKKNGESQRLYNRWLEPSNL